MENSILNLLLDESKWLAFSLCLAFVCVSIIGYAKRDSSICFRYKTIVMMNLMFGITIGIMSFGHLFSVTTKLILGTLEGSIFLLYLIGIILAVPSWWLIYQILSKLNLAINNKTIVILNSWTTISLLVLGFINIPLAIPGILNVGYCFNKHRRLDYIIVGLTIIIYLFLLVGSIIFFISGKSFEQVQGIN
jgi:hypothetical protein